MSDPILAPNNNRSWTIAAAMAGLLAAFVAGEAGAQNAPVTYTDAQAAAGATAYKARCAGCHGEQLEGQLDAPPLVGGGFAAKWKGGPVKNLYDFVKMNMPQDAPNSLSPEVYADIVAYLLKQNKVPSGAQPLPPNPPATMVIP